MCSHSMCPTSDKENNLPLYFTSESINQIHQCYYKSIATLLGIPRVHINYWRSACVPNARFCLITNQWQPCLVYQLIISTIKLGGFKRPVRCCLDKKLFHLFPLVLIRFPYYSDWAKWTKFLSKSTYRHLDGIQTALRTLKKLKKYLSPF